MKSKEFVLYLSLSTALCTFPLTVVQGMEEEDVLFAKKVRKDIANQRNLNQTSPFKKRTPQEIREALNWKEKDEQEEERRKQDWIEKGKDEKEEDLNYVNTLSSSSDNLELKSLFNAPKVVDGLLREERMDLPSRVPQKDLIPCPISLDGPLVGLQQHLRKSIVWRENTLKHLKTKLKSTLETLQLGDLQNPLQQLIPLLIAPEELVIPSEKGSLGIVLEGFHNSKRKTAIDVLTHPAFEAVNYRIKSCENLAKQLENKGFKDAANLLNNIKAHYKKYKKGFLEFNPETMEEDYKNHLTPKAELYGTLLTPSLIPLSIAYQIVSRTALYKEDKQNKEGTHAVRSLGNMHFKAYDYDNELALCPGKEVAMYHLYRLLIGEGVAPTTLLCLAELPFVDLEKTGIKGKVNQALQDGKNILHESPHLEHQLESHKNKVYYPLQVSSTIKGVGFHTFLQNHFFAEWLKKNSIENAKEYLLQDHEGNSFRLGFQRRFVTFIPPKSIKDKEQKQIKEQEWHAFLEKFYSDDWSLERIDEDSFARMALMSFLTDPGDSKADNFMLTKKSNSDKWQIVSIDTDRVLEPNFKKIESGIKEGHHQVHHKSLFYTLPFFMKEKKLSQTLKNEFKEINAPLKLAQWLLTLRDENKAYEILRQESALPEKTYASMKLPITFQKGQILTLLQRIESLQKIFEVHDFNLTLDRTFELMHPLLHAYYGKLQSRYLDPLGMIYADTTQPNIDNQELTFEAVLKEEGLKQKDEEGRLFKALLQNEPVSSVGKEQTLEETLEELIHFVNTRAQENQQKLTKTKSSSPILNMQELTLDASDITLFKRMINVQGPQTANANLARKFYRQVVMKTQDPELHRAWDLLVNVNQKLQWYMGFENLFLTPEEAKVYEAKEQKKVFKITGASEGEKYLPQEVWDQLINEKNEFKRQNQDGAHAVGKATRNGYTLYFKFLPKLPGLEEAVGRWTRNLIGFGAPHVELFRLGNDPVLVSQEIKGLTLKETIQKYPERLEQLDPKSLAQVFLTTMLINPEDGKPDNYIVEKISDNPPLHRIVGIDNDQAFVPAVAKEQKKGWFKALPVVQVKSILYCLDYMDIPIHPETRAYFKSLDPYALLSTWLNELDLVHQRQVNLFANSNNNNELLTKLFKQHDSYVGVPFKKGDLHEFYDRFLRLQKALHDPNVKTYHDLLMQVEPRLGKRYGALMHDPKCPKDLYEKFKFIDGESFSKTMGTLTSGKDTLQGKGISEKEAVEDIIKRDRHYTPKIALKELERRVKEVAKMEISSLLQAQSGNIEAFASEAFRNKFFKDLDFNHAKLDKGGKIYGPVSINVQQALLKGLTPYELYDLTLNNCQAFNNSAIDSAYSTPPSSPRENLTFDWRFKIQNLTYASLTGCFQVNSATPALFSECKGLLYLDLSRSPNLTYVDGRSFLSVPLSFPSLKKFFVNQCSNLKQINIHGDKLNVVEVQKNTNLLKLKIQSKTLKILNINKSSQITDQILDELGDNLPNLETIVCKECPQLMDEKYRQQFPLLSQTTIDKSILEKIKKAYEQKLTRLELGYGKRAIGDAGAYFFSQNTILTVLKLTDSNISSKGAKAFKDNTTLTSLDLGINKISDEGAQALAQNTTIQELHLGFNNISNKGARALSKNTTLTSLWLIECKIGDEGAKTFKDNTTLTELNLWNNNISNKGAKTLAQNTTLTSLDLGNNNIGDEGTQALAKNTTLKYLYLSGWRSTELRYFRHSGKIGNEGAKAFEYNTTLVVLDLTGNKIGAEGAKALAKNTMLRSINLDQNNIGDEGVQALAENTTLISLSLQSNNISDEGAKAFLQNTTLTKLYLGIPFTIAETNKISEGTMTLIDQMLERNKKRKEEEEKKKENGKEDN